LNSKWIVYFDSRGWLLQHSQRDICCGIRWSS
jgi:hypothetical protein